MKRRIPILSLRNPWVPGALISLVAALCCLLAVLQYRWIGEISDAERLRRTVELRSGLQRIATDLSRDLQSTRRQLQPSTEDPRSAKDAYEDAFRAWRATGSDHTLIANAGIGVRNGSTVQLLLLNSSSGTYVPAAWPAHWNSMRQQIEARARGERPPLPQPGGVLQEHPRFGGANGTERDWLIVEWNLDAIRRTVLPTLAERHLANRSLPVELRVGAPAGSVRLDLGGPPGMNMSWSLAIPSMESPIEAIVANVRRRNLMIAGAILSMLLGALWLLLRLTRSINRYSEMQMEFVANVSHELRTPLTVIRTAAFNLRGKIAANPQHVERYGKLIQEESEKLTGIVERVLQFAGAKSGGMVRKLEATSIAECIDAALASKSSLLLQAGCILERDVDDNLPPVMADSMAMRGVIENLIQNALKYGMEGGDWLRVAAKFDAHRNELVISVADHGPGIPPEEQGKIFDPFYRGRRAVEEQIHGTGLGLNLVRTIVEAHSGTIQVESKIGAGTEFQIRLPAAPVESFDEFAHTAR